MAKLDNPPHVPHWVRYNYPDLEKTKKELLAFARSMPRYTYSHAMKLLGDRLHLRTEWDTLLKSAERDGRENSRHLCTELLRAFQEFEGRHDLKGLKAYDFELLPWKISNSIKVPVRPLTSLFQNGKLEPIFVFGWASFPLDRYQIRLLMTVIEDAVFSLQDYQSSKGHFIIMPRQGPDKDRAAQVWHRGDYDLLSDSEVRQQVDVYLEALEFVRGETAADKSKPKEEAHSESWFDHRQLPLGI